MSWLSGCSLPSPKVHIANVQPAPDFSPELSLILKTSSSPCSMCPVSPCPPILPHHSRLQLPGLVPDGCPSSEALCSPDFQSLAQDPRADPMLRSPSQMHQALVFLTATDAAVGTDSPSRAAKPGPTEDLRSSRRMGHLSFILPAIL